MLGDEQKLYIKTEPIDCHYIKQVPEFEHIECLKTTLRIVKSQARHRLNNKIYHASALLTAPWLVRSYKSAIQSTRAKCEVKITVSDRFDQFGHFLDRRREVGVGKQCDIGLCGEQAGFDCETFST